MKALLFSDDGCSSCRIWKPLFKKLMMSNGIEYEIVNPNVDKEIKRKYGVKGIPDTIFLDDDGNEIGHILGNMNEELAVRQIEYYKNGRV